MKIKVKLYSGTPLLDPSETLIGQLYAEADKDLGYTKRNGGVFILDKDSVGHPHYTNEVDPETIQDEGFIEIEVNLK